MKNVYTEPEAVLEIIDPKDILTTSDNIGIELPDDEI